MKILFARKHDARTRAIGWCLACIGILSASITALLFNVMAKLTWPENLMLMATTAALCFGVAFSVLEMRRLAGKNRNVRKSQQA